MFRYAIVSRQQADQIERVIQAALQAADPRAAVARALFRCPATGWTLPGSRLIFLAIQRIRLVGAGKASPAMASGLLDVLGERVHGGRADCETSLCWTGPAARAGRVAPGRPPGPIRGECRQRAGAGPFFASRCAVTGGEDDLLFMPDLRRRLGLMTLPVEGITLDDLQELTRLLLACGADIGEINTLRKHLDQVKGGGLARLAAPARVITLDPLRCDWLAPGCDRFWPHRGRLDHLCPGA